MKTASIETLLQWAFVEELPKVAISGGSSMFSATAMMNDFADLGTIIDRTPNAFGLIPSFEEGEPHADALIIGEAVRGLKGRTFDLGAGWNPCSNWDDPHGVIAAAVEAFRAEWIAKQEYQGSHVAQLVMTCAILKRGPDWRADAPKVDMVRRAGKPAWFVLEKSRTATGKVFEMEADGFDARKQRQKPGAYRKYTLAEPLGLTLQHRLDWQIWQSALAFLAEDLPSRLTEHRISQFWAVRQPWLLRDVQ